MAAQANVNLAQAIQFITLHGTLVDQAGLRYLLKREVPARATVEALFAGQRPDGSWSPFWAPDYGSLDATCFRLAQAHQLGLTIHESAIEHAVNSLLHRQRADGSWQEEDGREPETPPWVKPGDITATLYLTANCGFWLALLAGPLPATLQTSRFLSAHLLPSGSLPGFLHTNWLAASLWYRIAEREMCERVLTFLGQRLINATFSPANLSWLITSLCASGLSPTHPLVERAATLLAQQQLENGRWAGDDGSAWDVLTTLEALRALRLCQKC